MCTRSSMADVIVIGGGAAGMMAAITAARNGRRVTLLEPERDCGRKLRITGKGRCNVTNACDCPEFLKSVLAGSRFLRPSLYRFTPWDAMSFFEELGVELKVERGDRVFPVSDRAQDVVDALRRELSRQGVQVLRRRALEICTADGAVTGVRTAEGLLAGSRVILCTGGLSYPATGSTGDGYAMAKALGHTVTPLQPSLVPLEAGPDCEELQGLSLRNVTLTAYGGSRVIYKELGEMLFTHYGVSGPLVLSASVHMRSEGPYSLSIDLKPGLSPEKLDERLLRDFSENRNRCFRNALDALLPQKLIPVIIRRSGIDPDTRVNAITRGQRLALGELIKGFELSVYGFRPIAEAIVTAGGIDVSEVDPRSMESRLVQGLHFAGEVLDIDGYTGGFNLQIAWCTAVFAGGAV
ncbi:MAG: NAD(P)/FAD-dependent oxidoreductase [Oscillospiraceae bacterium]|nr:NAD(P)/FAD-dependent oxidoreductase [Oscillospiraceae bacterium]